MELVRTWVTPIVAFALTAMVARTVRFEMEVSIISTKMKDRRFFSMFFFQCLLPATVVLVRMVVHAPIWLVIASNVIVLMDFMATFARVLMVNDPLLFIVQGQNDFLAGSGGQFPQGLLILNFTFKTGTDDGVFQDSTDDRDWSFNRGPTGSSGTGPKSGHGGANDGYFYYETSNPANEGDVAR